MAYIPTNWQEKSNVPGANAGKPRIGAALLNKMEQGIKAAHDAHATLEATVAALPTVGLYDGKRVLYQAPGEMAAQGVIWDCIYFGGIGDAYKWVVLGGAPLYKEKLANESLRSSVGYALFDFTGGPQMTVPNEGIYDSRVSCHLGNSDVAVQYVDAHVYLCRASDSAQIMGVRRGWTADYFEHEDVGEEFRVTLEKVSYKLRGLTNAAGALVDFSNLVWSARPVRIAP